MKHLALLMFSLAVTMTVVGQIEPNMYVRGDINGWGSTGMTYRSLGTNNWLVSIVSTSDRAASGFKFDNETNWVNGDWSRGDVVTLNSYTTWYNPNGGPNGTFVETNTKYYTFTIADVADGTNSQGFVMETSASPISISSVSDNHGSGVSNTSITVSITLSGSKSAEENVYIRYSTDGWTNDNWVLATGSGASYSGDISLSGSGSIAYYVLTTTLTSTGSGDLDNYPDLCTINYDNNSGSNYTYSYDQSLPVSLSKFSGKSMNGFVQLNWATDSEIENLGFNVYRSLADNPLELLASFTNTKSLEGYGSTNNYHEYNYNDNRVEAGQTYRYVLADVDYNGVEKRHDDRTVTLTYAPNADEIKPVKFALSGAYPNPFNPSTTIQYSVPEAGQVAFVIYDLNGRELWSASEMATSAGSHQLTWLGLNTNGQLLPSGLYIVQMRAGNFQATQKLSLVR